MKIIKEKANGQEELSQDEYFSLMVTDHHNKYKRDRKDYLDFDKGWIGIERTSEGKIYISKDWTKRNDRYRGDLIVVKVEKEDKICLLNY